MKKRLQNHHFMMMSLSKRLILSLRRPIFLYLTTVSFSLISLSSWVIYYFEKDLNPRMLHWGDALYYSVTIMTSVGLGDITPVTGAGKLVSALMMLSGTAIYVAFTASLATVLLETEKEEGS